MSSKESFVKLKDGASVYVKVLGGDDENKPLLIALHGAPGLSDHNEPEGSFGFLSDRYRVLVYDARGSGSSDWKGPYTDDQWLTDLDELREWAGAEKIFLAGGSYGSFLAIQYTLAHPDRVAALVLRGTWANGVRGVLSCIAHIVTSPRIQPDLDRQVRLWGGRLRGTQDFLDSFDEIVAIYAPPKNGGDKETTKTEAEVTQPTVFESAEVLRVNYEAQNYAFRYNQPRFDVVDRLCEIVAPTVVLAGRLDPVTTPLLNEEVARGIPNAQLVFFEKSGHAPASDEPEAWRENVGNFLGSLDLKW